MPTTTKRFYIVKADDHAVVKSVPVSVCAVPQRVDVGGPSAAPTCAVDAPTPPQDTSAEPRSGEAVSVKHASRRPGLLHRPHLPHIVRPGR